ncbi:hypothetical protein CRYUN_Cryun32bG0051000 [Craigia yunnanensis]
MNNAVSESEGIEVEESVSVDNVDPLDKFLPPPPKAKCSEELQRKIDKFLNLKRAGKSFNAEVRNRKDYRNPDFLLHAVRYQDIDQIGSCFSKDVFDPHGYDKSNYYDEIDADMKRERERKEQESKKNQKVDFISGGSQPGAVLTAPKVDSDRRNPLPAGAQDSLSTVGAHTDLVSAANAGIGYTAFAKNSERQKRKDPVKRGWKEDLELTPFSSWKSVPKNCYEAKQHSFAFFHLSVA